MKDKKAKDYPHKLRLCMDGLENALKAMEKLEALEALRRLAGGLDPISGREVKVRRAK